MSLFDISVIVPTHNRRDLLPGLLASLAAQTMPARRWQLIIVDDGSTDGAADLLEQAGRALPMRATVIRKQQGGAGSARNIGAERAGNSLLLFLDDDMIAAPALVEEHCHSHRDRRTAVIGGISPPLGRREPWIAWEDAQLKLRAEALADGRRLPGPRDFYTGNCSLPAELFWSVNGFDVGLKRGEDFQLGYRLAASGARLVYCATAGSTHLGRHSFQTWAQNAVAFGRSEVACCSRLDTGTLRAEATGWYRQRHILNRWLVRLCSRQPALRKPLIAVIDRLGRIGGRCRAGPVASAAYSAIYNLSYWQGLLDALGPEDFWREVDLTETPPGRTARAVVGDQSRG